MTSLVVTDRLELSTRGDAEVVDITERIAEKVSLPPGYTVEYGGQFENQQRAMKRLSVIVPTVIALVLVMLWVSFGTIRHALIIIINVPLAMIGGILGLLITRQYLSVHRVPPQRVLDIRHPRMRVLTAARHSAPLRLGHHRGNRFAIS